MKRAFGAVLLVILAASCGGDSGGPTDTPVGPGDVAIRGLSFSPSQRVITAGTSVTWINQDGDTHTTTGGNGQETWDSGQMAPDRSFAHTFNVPGTYRYSCTIHPEMQGTIVVN
jgi:plastocyanin